MTQNDDFIFDMSVDMGISTPGGTSLPKNLRKRIEDLTTETGTEAAIWRWSQDPINEKDVQKISQVYLVGLLKAKKRQKVRRVEEKARETEKRAQGLKEDKERRTKWASGEWSVVPSNLIDAGYQYLDRDRMTPGGDWTMKIVLDGLPIISEKGKTWITTTEEGKSWAKKNSELLQAIKTTDSRHQKSSKEYQDKENQHRIENSKKINQIIEDFASTMKAQWTKELLSSTFQINGTTVVWGEASIEQHEERLSMLKGQAHGILETAALHRQAITELSTSSSANLNTFAGGAQTDSLVG